MTCRVNASDAAVTQISVCVTPVAQTGCVESVKLRRTSARAPSGSLDDLIRLAAFFRPPATSRNWPARRRLAQNWNTAKTPCQQIIDSQRIDDGGEGGIRTLSGPLDSVSYRFYNADIAVNAGDAVAPCPLLPAPRASFRRTAKRACGRRVNRTRLGLSYRGAQVSASPSLSVAKSNNAWATNS